MDERNRTRRRLQGMREAEKRNDERIRTWKEKHDGADTGDDLHDVRKRSAGGGALPDHGGDMLHRAGADDAADGVDMDRRLVTLDSGGYPQAEGAQQTRMGF